MKLLKGYIIVLTITGCSSSEYTLSSKALMDESLLFRGSHSLSQAFKGLGMVG